MCKGVCVGNLSLYPVGTITPKPLNGLLYSIYVDRFSDKYSYTAKLATTPQLLSSLS